MRVRMFSASRRAKRPNSSTLFSCSIPPSRRGAPPHSATPRERNAARHGGGRPYRLSLLHESSSGWLDANARERSDVPSHASGGDMADHSWVHELFAKFDQGDIEGWAAYLSEDAS